MADSILRLKVESQEYDQKIKRASEGILKYAEDCRKAGGTLEYLDEGVEDFVKALGQMNTVSNSAKGKINEMTRAFTDLSLQYKNLTDEEKASPFGKALQGSLDQLKGRITDAKKDLADVNKELGDTGKEGQSAGSILDQLSSKFGISTKALTTWGAAIGAGAAALKVAKDAFFASEQNLDDWNRMVYSSQSTYEAFLTSLNTGDISGFLSRIGQIQQAAFDAYNAIDRLQTMQNIQSPKVAQKQAEVQRMETMLRTGRYVAPIDGRTSTEGLKTGDVLTAEQKKRIADQLASGMKEIAALTKNEVSAATDAINALYREQAQVLGMSNEEFKKGTASMAAFEANLEKARKYREFEAQHTTRTQMNTAAGVVTQNIRDNVANPYEAYKNWAVFKDDGKLYQRLINEIKNRSQAESQYYSQMGRAYRGINRAEGITPYGGSGSKQLTAPEKAQQKFEQAEKDYQQALEQAALEVKAGTANTAEAKKKELSAAENLWKSIGDAREIYDSEELKKAQEDAAKKVVELGGSVNALVEEQKKAQEAARELTSAQKKAAEANRKMADALDANDYKAYSAAYKQYQTAKADVQRLQPVEVPILPKWEQTFMDALPEELKKYGSKGIEVPVSMSYTQNNLSAFINRLNEQLSQAPLGTTLYQNLTAQLADANMLANLMQTAVKNGIDIAQFDPQGLFNQIFGENPGDYIDDAKWEELRKKIEEIIGKPITIDVNTGTVNVGGKTTGSKTDGQKDFNSLINNVSNITRSLDQLGVEIPEGFAKTISIMQIISSLITTISSMTAAQGISGALSNIPIVGGVLGFFGSLFGFQNGGMVHAANGFSGIVPGNSFSGDNIPAMLNAGETVLTRAQSGVIASALNGIENGGNVSRSMATIESDQIRIVLQNGAQAKGMTLGEYLGLN